MKFFICLSIPHLSLMMHKVLSSPFLILYPSLSFILCDVHGLLCYKLFKDIITLYIYMHWNNLCNLWSKTCYIWLHSFSWFTLPSQPFLFILIFATMLCFPSHQISKSRQFQVILVNVLVAWLQRNAPLHKKAEVSQLKKTQTTNTKLIFTREYNPHSNSVISRHYSP